MALRHWFLVLLLCASAPSRVAAHDSPDQEIADLTDRMKKTGETPELLAERAVNYRLLGKVAEAIADLERALILDSDSIPVYRELGRAHFANGKPDDALATLGRGLKLQSDDPTEIASLRIVRAEVLRSKKDYKKALEDCDSAIVLHNVNPEWYLLRSDIQARMKAHAERLAGIEEGIKQTGAGTLEIERVEALLDAGKFDVASAIIETELQDSRIKSSWLIRRARVRIAAGKKAEAEEDLRTALAEIGSRLKPKATDLPLLLDKARALELLGEKREALRVYKEARDKGGSDDLLKDKIKEIEDSTAAPAKPDEPNKL